MAQDGFAVRLRAVSKKYPIYARNIDRVKEALHPLGKTYHHDFWALREVDLDIGRGETLGILGVNGSGKSTLLQIVCSILQPTSGTAQVTGRVAALIELGAGFNRELTGRENAETNCMIAGLSLREARAALAPIAAFADIGEFFDQPVKTYSSGMFMRVAFATAVNVDPDILVIDEALAVGDARFQQKCFAKFREFQAAGKTILLVTHDRYTIPRLCTAAVMMHDGRVREQGDPRQVTDAYSRFLQLGEAALPGGSTAPAPAAALAPAMPQRAGDRCPFNPTYNKHEHRYGKGGAAIIDYRLSSEGKENPGELRADAALEIRVWIRFDRDVEAPLVGVGVASTDGVLVASTHSAFLDRRLLPRKAGETAEYRIAMKMHLAPGEWFVNLALAEDAATVLDTREGLIHLSVVSARRLLGIASLETEIDEAGAPPA
jgi:lipopolysaccharide transport system ATP-binding protein